MSNVSDTNTGEKKVASAPAANRRKLSPPDETPVVISARVEEHPVVRAWATLAGKERAPAYLELLRTRKKSVVYRVPGVGSGGTDVIVKKCRIEGARLEATMYEKLSTASLEMPTYYGLVEDASNEWGWLFVEDVAGEPYDSRSDLHRSAGARWLAILHTATGLRVDGLPERRAGYYEQHLRLARQELNEQRSRLRLDDASRHTLEAALRMCDAIEARWSLIRAVCDTIPGTLVHNDFSRFNVRVRAAGSVLRVYAFDWEMAGVGLPTIDLLIADVDEYWRRVQSRWPQMTYASLERGLWVATLLRGIASVHWDATHLHPRSIDLPLGNIRIYLQRMNAAQRRLGWWARSPS